MPSCKKQPGSALTLWLWVILAFLLLLGAWTALVIIAKRNQAERIEFGPPAP